MVCRIQVWHPISFWSGPAPIDCRSRSSNVSAIILLQLVPPASENVVVHVGAREVGVFIVKMNIGLYMFGHPSGNEPFDCRLFLGPEPFFFGIMSLPL